ncbi:MAG: hypothetical protein CMJ32_05490 [Phycisphaerae bacterium]|nr:hypothetical protein [Phycisphaerae bacterium]
MNSRRFLTIIKRADNQAPAEMAKLLEQACGFDIETAILKANMEPPSIFSLKDGMNALDFIRKLNDMGGQAFECTLRDIESLGRTRMIRSIDILDGRLELDMWREDPVSIQREEVRLICHGRIRNERRMHGMATKSRPRVHQGPSLVASALASAIPLGIAATLYARREVGRDSSGTGLASTTRMFSDKIDIITRQGDVFQVDANRFNFDVLGDLKGLTDQENVLKLCDLLSHVTPNEIMDPYFPLWIPPAGYHLIHLDGMKTAKEYPAFAFYSRWSWLMYRHMLGDAW